jgi:hypothetical protein
MSELVIKNKVAQYLLINTEIKELQSLQKQLKEHLEPALLEAETNARGSRVITFTDPLEIDGIRYKSLQKVRKESKVLNEERALKFLKSDQAFESAVITVDHVDQDALWDLFVQDMISQEELDSFFDVTESFAFMPTKE